MAESPMNTFINLSVADVKRSRAFFSALGFTFNEYFCDDNTLAMKLSDTCFVMMLEPDRFRGFLNNREIADTTKTTEVLTAFSCEDRAAVDALMEKALASGATEFRPAEDHGFMYGRSFADPDGHVWEPHWFDVSTIPKEYR